MCSGVKRLFFAVSEGEHTYTIVVAFSSQIWYNALISIRKEGA